MLKHSIAEIAESLARGTYSSVEITSAYLQQIAQHNDELNAFITVTADNARAQAAAADKARARGEAGVFTGVPIAHKDIFCTTGVRTSCGSRMLDNFIAPYD